MQTDDYIHEENPEENPNRFFRWTTIILIGLLLYEATAEPGFAVFGVAIKFGWDQFVCARWLWYTDPWKKRGRILGTLYFAWGLTRIAGVSLGIIALMVLLESFNRKRGANAAQAAPHTQVYIVATLTMFVAIFVSSLLSVWVICVSSWHSLRFWLAHIRYPAMRKNQWPPQTEEHNHATTFFLINCLVLCVLCLCLGFALMGLIIQLWGGPRNPHPLLIGGLSVITIMAAAVTLLKYGEIVSNSIATHPDQTWGSIPASVQENG